jgi:hypothetical protein
MGHTGIQYNLQLMTGARADRPDPTKVPGGDFYFARDTLELFENSFDPAGVQPNVWVLISGPGGMSVHPAVLTASTGALPSYTATLDTLTMTAPGAVIIGGVVPPLGARVLIKNEPGALAANDGIFVVVQSGDVTHPLVLTRADDAIQGELVSGSFVFVESGTLAATGWVLTTPDPITVGVTLQTWAQFSGAGTYTAAAPVTLTGTVFGFAGTDVAASGTVQHFTLASDSSAGSHKITSLAAGTAATDAVNLGQLSSDTAGGAVRAIRVPFTTTGTYDSVATIPAGATVLETRVVITTAYPSGATVTVGQPGSLVLLQNAQDNFPSDAIPPGNTSNRYIVDEEVAWGGAPAVVRVTVAGAASGAGFAIVLYATPAT